MVSIAVPKDAVIQVCRQFQIQELALFGSVLSSDFRPDSDIDVLVTFERHASADLFDLVELKEAMEAIFHRPVDLIEKDAIKNPFRRKHILQNMEVIYAA